MKRLLIILLFYFPLFLIAQEDCACCTDYHKQFDFWTGDWVVYDTTGNIVGENIIQKVEGGCMLTEQWTGASGGTGRSINFFDRSDSSWHQTWVDNTGNILRLKGGMKNQSMILQSKLIEGTQIDYYKNRITWTPNKNRSVTQKWEILDKNNNVLQTLFLGIYKTKQHEK